MTRSDRGAKNVLTEGATMGGMTDPLAEKCSLCHVVFSTDDCLHLLDLGDGRVVLSREVWEALVEDRLRLREVLHDDE